MKCFRRIMPIKAISFDLDDTLYSNRPIMEKTEQAMIAYFAQLLGDYSTQEFNYRFWWPFRNQAIAAQPQLKHDVTALRKVAYHQGMLSLGMTEAQADQKSTQALDYFYAARSDFVLPESCHQLMTALQANVPLVAITNGNVDTDKIDISKYFTEIYHAGAGLISKPDPDMFTQACKALAIKPNELLHVGDCGRADILGGINAGCQTAWFPEYGVGKPLTVLPHIVLDDVAELLALVQ